MCDRPSVIACYVTAAKQTTGLGNSATSVSVFACITASDFKFFDGSFQLEVKEGHRVAACVNFCLPSSSFSPTEFLLYISVFFILIHLLNPTLSDLDDLVSCKFLLWPMKPILL